MTKYILVEWPESQQYIGHPECFLCTPLDWNEEDYNDAYFVPEHIYNKDIDEDLMLSLAEQV